jgi:uncharacterized protein YecE (DUF72 family)
MKVYVGCSGFHYSDWKNKFYPEDLPKNQWLDFYANHFNTVEVNNTFYSTPTKKTLMAWKKSTPENFRFSIKANRYFTHMKKMNVDDDFLARYMDFKKTLRPFKDKMDCLLWQMPGNIEKNVSKLQSFCKVLENDFQHVIEFRHASWFTHDIFSILNEHNITFCMVSAPKKIPEIAIATNKTGYLRLHGKSTWYKYKYSEQELEQWKLKLEQLELEELYVYFNNDVHANATENARMFAKMLQGNKAFSY